MAANRASNKYKIKLQTGRVVGPIDLERLSGLIRKGHVRGDELVKSYPDGDWKPLAQYAELAQLVISLASGEDLSKQTETGEGRSASHTRREQIAPTQILAATQILPDSAPQAPVPAKPLPELEQPPQDPVAAEKSAPVSTSSASDGSIPIPTAASVVLEGSAGASLRSGSRGSAAEPDERTVVAPLFEQDDDGTKVGIPVEVAGLPSKNNIYSEKTVIFERSTDSRKLPGKKEQSKVSRTRNIIVILACVWAGLEIFTDALSPRKKAVERAEELRPRLPSVVEKNNDPKKSNKIYLSGLEHYRHDSIPDYRKAVGFFTRAAEFDAQNVKALAMLASSYLNLIDVSNKDENYFAVIRKLIDLSKAKEIGLTETIIAEVEYLLFIQQPSAAQNRIIEYSKTHKNYDPILILYLAQVLVARGDYATAARWLAQLSDDRPYSVKVFYLRGQVAEGLGDPDAALEQYRRAIKLNPRHGFSHFRILKILEGRAELKTARKQLVFLARNPDLLPARELAQVLSWGATAEEADGRIDVALGLVERALRLEPGSPAYSLQYFLLRGRAGDSNPKVRKDARLYYYLAEGERLAREGKVDDALIQFLEAARESPKSPIPLVKRGDLFYNIKKDFVNARLAYKKAADLAPRDVDVWARYIELLIQSFEWEEAAKAQERFRKLPVRQSIIDKVSGDWHARQGKHAEAQSHYRRAMSRSYIDPGVYLAYGKSLIASKSYQLAPFVFSLAMRLDPENHEAILGTAESLAGTEGLDRAVSYLKDELQKGRGTRVELMCGIAALLIQKGRLEQAEEWVEQAKTLRPEAAEPWKLTADIALARGTDKKSREKAEAAYQAYLSRNPSDATIMYQRYRVLVDLERYEQADMELGRIYESYPKYPSLHYSKGQIYVKLGNFKNAIREFEQEMKNGNNSTANLVELGKAHLEINEADKALSYFVRAIKDNPGASEPKFQAGRASYVLTRYEAAVAMYQEALRIDAGNPLIYRHLGYAYRAMGDAGAMRWAFSKYLEMEPDASDKAEIQKNL